MDTEKKTKSSQQVSSVAQSSQATLLELNSMFRDDTEFILDK